MSSSDSPTDPQGVPLLQPLSNRNTAETAFGHDIAYSCAHAFSCFVFGAIVMKSAPFQGRGPMNSHERPSNQTDISKMWVTLRSILGFTSFCTSILPSQQQPTSYLLANFNPRSCRCSLGNSFSKEIPSQQSMIICASNCILVICSIHTSYSSRASLAVLLLLFVMKAHSHLWASCH